MFSQVQGFPPILVWFFCLIPSMVAPCNSVSQNPVSAGRGGSNPWAHGNFGLHPCIFSWSASSSCKIMSSSGGWRCQVVVAAIREPQWPLTFLCSAESYFLSYGWKDWEGKIGTKGFSSSIYFQFCSGKIYSFDCSSQSQDGETSVGFCQGWAVGD